MLALYRMESDIVEKTSVNPTTIANEISAEIHTVHPQREFKIHIEESLNTQGDPTLIRIVLENLFSNAVKYSKKMPFTEITFGQIQNAYGERIYFLRDNGAGFSPKDQYKLFQPLSRLHGAGEFSGNGIGLASVAKIIKAHGGRI